MTRALNRLLALALVSALGCGSSAEQPPGNDLGTTPDQGGGHDMTPPDGGPPPPDMTPPPPPARPQAGGVPSTLTFAGKYAYVAVGPRLSIWDVSDPAAPVLRGETEAFDGNVQGVAVAGKYAYLGVSYVTAIDGRLVVVDVSDPTAPKAGKQLRLFDDPAQSSLPMGMATDGKRLYAADHEYGVVVLDLKDPAAPVVTKSLRHIGATSVDLVGTRLYANAKGFDGLSVAIYDVSGEVTEIGTTQFQFELSLAITPAHVAIATGSGGQIARDLSDPANPRELTVGGSNINSASVAAGANGVWFAAFDGLYPATLTADGLTIGARVEAPTDLARTMVASGNLVGLLTGRGRLVTIDVSAAAAPVVKRSSDVTLCADCGQLVLNGNNLVIADWGGGLRTGNPTTFASLGRADVLGEPIDFEGVAVAANIAYVADWFGGLRIYDLTDPAAPKALGTLAVADGLHPSSVAVDGNRAYVVDSTNGGVLHAIDISDPRSPMELGAVATSFSYGVVTRNKLAYVADQPFGGNNGGLHIFDVTDATAMALVGSYEGCPFALDIALGGDVVGLACGGSGWDFVDVSDPKAPKLVGHLDAPADNEAKAVTLAGKRAYLGHTSGIFAVDMSDPRVPTVLGARPTRYDVRHLLVTKPGHLMASCSEGGVYQWDVP